MTPQPLAPPRLLTVTEYLALGEIEPGYSELVEGRVVISSSPVFDHNYGASEMWLQIRSQLSPHLVAVRDIDVDLELAPPDAPGFVRRPDLIVVHREARLRVRRERGVVRASEVLVVVEFVSAGSRRTDHVTKRGDYADAGIPHYWIVDLTEPVSLLACHLAGEFGYADSGAVIGTFTATEPFPVKVDLDALH